MLMDTRRLVQWLSAIISNAYFKGFASLSIYQGVGKRVCVPVLNCYSCPGALGSCPVGSMQSLLGGYKQQFSFYVAGLLTVVGAASGRLACGWLCPFGLVQELLARISRRKLHLPALAKKLKYLVLLLTIVLRFCGSIKPGWGVLISASFSVRLEHWRLGFLWVWGGRNCGFSWGVFLPGKQRFYF